MAQTIQNIESKTKVLNQLDTYNYTVPSDSMYTVSIDMAEQPPSSLSIVIQQNGSTKATSTAPTTGQLHLPLQVLLNCVATDVISVIMTSSSDNDKQLNCIKGLLNIRKGTV